MEDLLNSYSDADITGAEAKSDAKLCILQSILTEIALSEEKISILRRKMRLLTLVGLCKANPDTTYKAIQDKLDLDEDGVEDLAVRAFQLKLLRGRLDQGN